MKPNPNYVAPKESLFSKAVGAFSENFPKGFTLDNLGHLGKASAPAIAIEAGAQGMQYVANNTTGNTQKVAQVGVDAMNSDTAQYAATGGMIGGVIGGFAGLFGFGVGALPAAAVGATIGTNLGASVGLLKDSLDGSLQAGNQNIKNGFNSLMDMGRDASSSIAHSFEATSNQISQINFGSIANSSSSLSTGSTIGTQGVRMMNPSMMPQMMQQEPGKGGLFDPTTTLSGMQNMANMQTQEMSMRQVEGQTFAVAQKMASMEKMQRSMAQKNPEVSINSDVKKLINQKVYAATNG